MMPAIPDAAPPPEGKNKVIAQEVLNVVMAAAECAPWSKTGGLGDVAGALPKALARRGHRVMCVAPMYEHYAHSEHLGEGHSFSVCGQMVEVQYWHIYKDGVDYVFVDHEEYRKNAGSIYGGTRHELGFRNAMLCQAAIEAIWHAPCGGIPYGDENLLFMANDWHTALLPVFLRAYYQDYDKLTFARCTMVVHNLAHQGRGPVADFDQYCIPEHYKEAFVLDDPVGGTCSNTFKAGLICCSNIVAVSHGYAWECQTDMGGWGLAPTLRMMDGKMRGIVNGIDTNEWNPAVDEFLTSDGYVNFPRTVEGLKEGKLQCKRALQRQMGWPERDDVPLIGFIGRLDQQKGVDIIGEARDWLVQQECQIIFLGTGREDLEDMLREMEQSHPQKVRSWIGFSIEMAHRITAACDILLMPSRFEPCGLNQLYAMQYGTVPVVHAVGGLRDTVQQFDPASNLGTGWAFDECSRESMVDALGHAIFTYRNHPDSFEALQLNGMRQDLSWDHAAGQYEATLIEAKFSW